MRDLKGLFKWREGQGERRFSAKAEKEKKKLAMADDAEDQQILLQKNENENENKKKEVQYPNCPGCKCAYLQHPDAGIPYKEFLSVFLLIFVACMNLLSLCL
jgi:hypothetical protein